MNTTCHQCTHFLRLGEESKGLCYANPPTVFSGGHCARPQVKLEDKSCSMFSERPNGVAVEVKTKLHPETPGAAAKAARQARIPVEMNRG